MTELPEGIALEASLTGAPATTFYLTWSADGRWLAAEGKMGHTTLWQPAVDHTPRSIIRARTATLANLAWHPTERLLAIVFGDGSVRLVHAEAEDLTTFDTECDVYAAAWLNGGMLALGRQGAVEIWNAATRTRAGQVSIDDTVSCIRTLPGDRAMLCGRRDGTIDLVDSASMQTIRQFVGQRGGVQELSLAPDTPRFGSASILGTIHVWDMAGDGMTVLEGHTSAVGSVAFSPSGHLLASAAYDNSVRLWRTDDWACIAAIPWPIRSNAGGLSFHPHKALLAVKDNQSRQIDLWRIDEEVLLRRPASIDGRRYVNAKVVLLGDTGVGKSGLGLVLSGQEYCPTDSTHARHVWVCDKTEAGDRTRETLIWDLAGQPGYRLVHQLHLGEVAVALLVFDARSETDPFAGVKHWMRALAQARRIEGDTAVPLRTFLVAARADRGGVGVSAARVEALVRELGIDGFFETSAKEGWQVEELTEAVRGAIDWDALPVVSSNVLFEGIRNFLLDEKQDGRLLTTADDLFRSYRRSMPDATEDLRASFETCIGRLEGRGLVRRLHFGDYVLLQPELLDAYASAVVQAAKDEPDGLGFVAEEDALAGRFRMGADERITDTSAERLLLIAMVEELLRHEVALKEVTDVGVDLVFPAQFTRERPDAPDVPGREVTFTFEGPLHNVYATLAVRLARSRLFVRETMWRNAATYRATVGGICGLYLREIEEGRGELALSFDAAADPTVRRQFEAYVHEHLRARAGAVTRRRTHSCPGCGYVLPDELVRRRLDRGAASSTCPACEDHVIDIRPEGAGPTAAPTDDAVSEMHRSATRARDRDVAATRLRGKIETDDHDVFLCYSSRDREQVVAVAEQLKERGILPWLDVWDLRPGTRWQAELAKQLASIPAVAMFLGPGRARPWQEIEVETVLGKFAAKRRPVIPVVLEGVRGIPTLPAFLELWQSVDLRRTDPDPIDRLVWGITGERRMP